MNKTNYILQFFPTYVNKNRITKIDKNQQKIFLNKKYKKSHNKNIRFILVERRVILDFFRFNIIRAKVIVSSSFGLALAGAESYNICM